MMSSLSGKSIKFKGKHIMNYNNISILQVLKESEQEIAYYSPDTRQLSVLYNITASPQGNAEAIPYTLPLANVILDSIATPMCFLYVTVIFILYIYFYKEPEIKATSVSVSLCMFVGCYLLLAFNVLLFIKETTIVCNLELWLSGIGISNLLIFATLCLKMLRVYVIFLKPLSFKRKLLSNPAIFIYITLILLPQVLILLVWAIADKFKSYKYTFDHDNRLIDRYDCYSKHTFIWIILLLIYLLLVIFITIILAFKSSKIRYKFFQDTKATNAFTFLAVFVTIIALIFWFFFRSLRGEHTYSSLENAFYTLCISHTLLAFLCPTFLFLPKVYLPLKRRFYENKIKGKE